MAVRNSFRYGDALYGSGASFHGMVDTEGADWAVHGHPGGWFADAEGADWGDSLEEPVLGAFIDSEGADWTTPETDGALLVPGDGTTWTTYGQTDQTIGLAQSWKYVASASGTLTVDTVGSAWNTTLTVYAADRTTVLGSSSTPGGLASVSVSVTARCR